MSNKSTYLLLIIISLFLFCSCGDEGINKNTSTPAHNTPISDKQPISTPLETHCITEPTQSESPCTISPVFEDNNPTISVPATIEPTTDSPSIATAIPEEPYDAYVTFSHDSGFYNKSFNLTLSYNKDVEIRYTTNGSKPTYKSGIFEGHIQIEDSGSKIGAKEDMIVIRAAAFEGNKQVSYITTNTYLLNGGYNSFNDRYGNMAVISISTDMFNLYGSTGIFTNYQEHGRESERPVHVEFFDTNGVTGFSVDAGLRVYGGTSRGLPQKSLKLVARKEYDPNNGKFKYPIFPDRTNTSGDVIDRYDSFILRSGGNDSVFGATRQTLLRDALVHSLAIPISNIAQQAYRPAVVYINGDYFGIYNIRDDLDNDYIEQHYEIPKEEVAIIAYGHENGQWFYKIDEGTDADLNDYKSTLSYITNHDMTNQYHYEEAAKRLDFDNFIKYIGINVYSNNRDWPHNNVRAWCHNGKWRFMLKDIDYSWGIYHVPDAAENVVAEEVNHSRNVLTGGEGGDISRAFASLMRNENFKKQFLDFMDEMINNYYSAETACAIINKMIENMQPEFYRYSTTYWYDNPLDSSPDANKHSLGISEETWLNATKTLYEYATKRPEVIKNLLIELYGNI